MNSLKKKIMLVLMTIFTLIITSITFLYNYSIYNREYRLITDRFIALNNQHNINQSFNPILFENDIYEVIFDQNGNIEHTIAYSKHLLTSEQINQIISQYSNSSHSLYQVDYLLMTNKNNHLMIMSNIKTKSYLIQECIKSILLLIFFEIIVTLISIKITKWITVPIEETFNKQKQFIYDASHELKTPLAIIQASIETFYKEPTNLHWINHVKEESQNMNRLVLDLLELSKTETTNQQVFVQTDLSSLVERSALSFESLMFENNLKLVTDIKKEISFLCDPSQIKEVIQIILDNAIKHAYKDTCITISLCKNKSNIQLSISNVGDEIEENQKDKIFERFYRIDKSRNREENRYGLGLSIARNIITNHKGAIKVESHDHLTTFIITLKQK